jgi:hypothetical protein
MEKYFAEKFASDLASLKQELLSFQQAEKLWEVRSGVSNSAGNLALHLIGNLNHFFGFGMAQRNYTRNRDAEFQSKNIAVSVLIKDIEELEQWLPSFLADPNRFHSTKEFSTPFLGKTRTQGEMLVILSGHFSYHLGQINYLRRLLV